MVPSWMRRTKGLNSAKKISTRFSSGEPTPSPSSLRERAPRLLRCGSIPSGGCSVAAEQSLCHALPGSTCNVCFMLHVTRCVINSRSMEPPDVRSTRCVLGSLLCTGPRGHPRLVPATLPASPGSSFTCVQAPPSLLLEPLLRHPLPRFL